MRGSFCVTALACLSACGGCTTLTTYKPAPNNPNITFDQGVGSVTWDTPDFALTMFPTFRYEKTQDIPVFTLMLYNKTNIDLDFDPHAMQAWFNQEPLHIYSMEERVKEIHDSKVRAQIALAIAGALAVGASAYSASHGTTTYSSYGTVVSRGGVARFFSGTTISTYDPFAGIMAGAEVGAATAGGIQQIATAAGYEEEAAQGIFQRTTVRPGMTVVGQVELQPHTINTGMIRIDVPVGPSRASFFFTKETQ